MTCGAGISLAALPRVAPHAQGSAMRRIVPAALVLLALTAQGCRDEATAPQLPRPRAQAAAGSECANPPPGTIWCDDFEVDRLSSYFERVSANTFDRTAGVGLDGS